MSNEKKSVSSVKFPYRHILKAIQKGNLVASQMCMPWGVIVSFQDGSIEQYDYEVDGSILLHPNDIDAWVYPLLCCLN